MIGVASFSLKIKGGFFIVYCGMYGLEYQQLALMQRNLSLR